MRLLNTKSLRIERVADIPGGILDTRYAILSHCWIYSKRGKPLEITYEDLAPNGEEHHELRNVEKTVQKGKELSYKKLQCAAEQAKQRGLGYIWIDTVCINSENAREKARAIRSMYRWYKESTVCFVFLDDLDFQPADFYPLRSDSASVVRPCSLDARRARLES